jgi:type IV secretory pathway VirB2 component (pilin)
MVGGFERAVGWVLGIGLMMEAAVGKGFAQPFV